MKSLAAIAWNVGDPWSVEEIDVEPPGPGEVLVEWAAAGLCHSDEGIRNGDRVVPEIESELFPLLGGHEGAGIVAEVGPGVTAFVPGDHVLANFAPACGECRYCTSGRGFICNNNKGFMSRGQLVDGSVKHRARGRDLCVMGKLGTFSGKNGRRRRFGAAHRPGPSARVGLSRLVWCDDRVGFGGGAWRDETR